MKSNKLKENIPPKFIVLSLLLFLELVLFFYQTQTTSSGFLEMAVTSIVTIFATFIGVYISFTLSINQEKVKEKVRSIKTFDSALKLIFSELDLNEKVLRNILLGLETMPFELKALHSSYELFIKVAGGIKTNNFYAQMTTNAMEEISQNDKIFNSLQQAYYNLEMTVNGLIISQDVFSEYPKLQYPNIEIEKQATVILKEEKEKITRSLNLIRVAKKIISEEIGSRNIKFYPEEIQTDPTTFSGS